MRAGLVAIVVASWVLTVLVTSSKGTLPRIVRAGSAISSEHFVK